MPKKKKQRDNYITVWMSRKLHEKVKTIAFDRGVSITVILNEIVGKYFEKEKRDD